MVECSAFASHTSRRLQDRSFGCGPFVCVRWSCPCQAPNKKGVQNRRFWLTTSRLHAALSANCSRNSTKQVHEPSAVGVSLDLTKIWIIQIFCYFCVRMRFVTQFILDYVNKFQLVSIVEIVLTNPRARDMQKDARARVLHACVRSNHYRTLATVCVDA